MPNRGKNVHRRGHRQLVSMILFFRQGGRCAYCQRPTWVKPALGMECRKATLDHRIPIALGGESYGTNVVVACLDCNKRKDSLSIAVFFMVRDSEPMLRRARQVARDLLRGHDVSAVRSAAKENTARSLRELYESLPIRYTTPA